MSDKMIATNYKAYRGNVGSVRRFFINDDGKVRQTFAMMCLIVDCTVFDV